MALSAYVMTINVAVGPPPSLTPAQLVAFKLDAIFEHKKAPIRYVLDVATDDQVHGTDHWLQSNTELDVASPHDLFSHFYPTPIQVGQRWRFADHDEAQPFDILRMTWREATGRQLGGEWQWQCAFAQSMLWLPEERILLGARRVLEADPAAPAPRRGNGKCPCGSDAIVLWTSVECFDPSCRSYRPGGDMIP
jgi:hypothetical protein